MIRYDDDDVICYVVIWVMWCGSLFKRRWRGTYSGGQCTSGQSRYCKEGQGRREWRQCTSCCVVLLCCCCFTRVNVFFFFSMSFLYDVDWKAKSYLHYHGSDDHTITWREKICTSFGSIDGAYAEPTRREETKDAVEVDFMCPRHTSSSPLSFLSPSHHLYQFSKYIKGIYYILQSDKQANV